MFSANPEVSTIRKCPGQVPRNARLGDIVGGGFHHCP
jgi:hypothetical protein